MPAPGSPGRDEFVDLIEACSRLAELQHGLAGRLRALGLLDEITSLTVIAQADQMDARIDQARTVLATYRP